MTAPTTTEERKDAAMDSGEGKKFAHYVDKSRLVEAAVNGIALMTLCGMMLTPSRDPYKLPMCPKCKEEIDKLNEFFG